MAMGCHGLGIASLDAVLGGGLALGRVHEIYAAAPEDGPASVGFAMAVASLLTQGDAVSPQKAIMWLRGRAAARHGGILQAPGWAEMGGAPHHGLMGVVGDGIGLLRAAVDALRCPALGAVVVESWGALRELDLTASRRLTLAAEHSGVPLLLLRIDAQPVPSSAQTRWQVASAPSRALPGHAPGMPCFDITLLRQRSGPGGLGWRLEWDRDQRMFREASPSGAVVPVSERGQVPVEKHGSIGREAA